MNEPGERAAPILALLARTQMPAAMERHWVEAMAALPPQLPAFLAPEQIAANRPWAGLEPELEWSLLEAARRIGGDPAWLQLAWFCYWLVYESPDGAPLSDWMEPDARASELAGLLYLLVGLAVVPLVRQHHLSLGVPEAVTRETCLQVRCMCDNHRRGHGGRPGIYLNQLGWLRHYTRELYFRLGRMEYWAKPYQGGVHAYRQRRTGRVIALAEDGVRFSRDGYIYRTEGCADDPEGWESAYVVDGAAVVGTPISPFGMAERRRVRLERTDWELVMTRGLTVLDMHIPAGGGMTLEAAGASMRQAAEFFQRYFPERTPAAFDCDSWIFNNQLEEILPAEANLVQYLRQLYLYPVPSSGRDGLWFLFLRDDADPSTWPRETRLQRAILDFLAAGHRWRGGGMFLLLDDLPHFGGQHYRRQYAPDTVATLLQP